MVGEPGFEPGTPCSQSKCASQLRYSPKKRPSITRVIFICNRRIEERRLFAYNSPMKTNKTLFIFLLSILCLLALAILYFQNIFLPVKLKKILSQKSNEWISREFGVGQVDYSLIKGFILKDVKLFEKDVPGTDLMAA